MTISTTKNQLFLVELAPPFSRMQIQFVPPDITWSRLGALKEIDIISRNFPFQHYTGGKESIKFTLDFFADDERRADAINKVNWLVSLTYNNASSQQIRNVKLIWGDLFKDYVWIVNTVRPVLTNFSALHNWLPVYASVELELKLDPERNLTTDDVRFQIP